MSIVVIGDLNPSTEQIERMRALSGDVRVLSKTTDRGVAAEAIEGARFVIACNYDLNPHIERLSRVELVILAETLVVCIDPGRAAAAGVRFVNLPSYSTAAVADYALRCVLESTRPWASVFEPYRPGDRSHKLGADVASLTVGLVGFGNIGRRVAAAASALGARVIANTRSPFRHAGVRWATREQVLAESNVLVLCCDLNPSSEGLIGAAEISRLPRGAALVSVSHRRVLRMGELAAVLRDRPDVRAWLDVDPAEEDAELASLPNVHLSPHVAFYTAGTLSARVEACIERISEHLQHVGSPAAAAPRSHRPLAGAWEDRAEERILRSASRFYESASLFAAAELRLFDFFDAGWLSPASLAEATGLDVEWLSGLLRALAAQGLLARHGESAYRLLPELRSLLRSDSPRSYVPTVEALHRFAYPAWGRLADAIRRGAGERLQDKRSSDPQAAAFCTRGSNAHSQMVEETVVSLLSERPVRRVLDVGCGAATITRGLLRRFPDATADLVDTQAVLDATRGYLVEDGVKDRCRMIPADFNTTMLVPEPVDLVLLSNVLHMESPDAARALVHRCAATAAPGGRLAVIGFFSEPGCDEDPWVSHFSLSCRLLARDGCCHELAHVERWLEEASCPRPAIWQLTRYVGMVVATRAPFAGAA